MAKHPKLTEDQKRRLRVLEPNLKSAALSGDYTYAKIYAKDIQEVLRATGHETRLMQAKNWLFEASMEAGKINIAIPGFIGITQKSSPQTRGYLEATALLAICYLKENKIDKAEPLIAEALYRSKNIKSERRRRQFKRRIVQRFEEESALSVLRNSGHDKLDIDEIQEEAGRLIQTKTDDEILSDLGTHLPRDVINNILRIHDFSGKQLHYNERKLLPSPEEITKEKELGKTIFSAFRRVLWKSFCDKESDIYKAWYNHGMSVVLDKKYVSSAIVASLTGFNIGIKALAISSAALIIKMGIETLCEVFRPKGIMIDRNEKD